MLRASALYIVIILAIVIAIFSGALISTAYFYRLEYQKSMRYTRLAANLSSGINLVLSKSFAASGNSLIDLYADGSDSVILQSEPWGVFDLATVKSFTLNDSLKKAFLIGNDVQKDLTAIYLSDEDRPLSVSGSTQITGDVQLPKAGIKQAYVEGKPYAGKQLVNGAIKNSERNLPALKEELLARIQTWFTDTSSAAQKELPSTSRSFYESPLVLRLNHPFTLSGTTLEGKIVIISDSILTVKKDASLKDILVFAPAIVLEEGFRGSCQLFATDSVVAGKNSVFNYPSCIGVLKPEDSKSQARIQLGAGSVFSGILFSYEKKRSDLQTIISLGKNSFVRGEVYASGYIKIEKPTRVEGKVSCNRFIIQTPTTLYENYLIDIDINRRKRNPYYLSSFLFTSAAQDKKVLRWLN